MNKHEALAALLAGDHAIFTVHHAQEIAQAFGVKVRIQTFRDSRSEFKGITLYGRTEGDEGRGVDAALLATDIAYALGADFEDALGIGTQLRRACAAIETAIGEHNA